MKIKLVLCNLFLCFILFNCNNIDSDLITFEDDFEYSVDEFSDIKVLRYDIPGWENLTLKEQKLVYYLTQAGLSGRDIMWDQNYRHNLDIRNALENVYRNYVGDKSSSEWLSFEVYLKRLWFSNGIHHHYSNAKIKPEFNSDFLSNLLTDTNTILSDEAVEVIFNDSDSKKVNISKGVDNVLLSAVNFYGPDVTSNDVYDFYSQVKSPNPLKPLSHGLNSRLVKEDGVLVEKVYKSGGLYGDAIDEIIKWLELAHGVSENKPQADALSLLSSYYKTGDLQTWDDYKMA